MITDLAIRILQIIFCAVVLGLSIVAVQWQHIGSAPAISTYAAFAGAFGILTALVGIAAVWVELLRSVIMMVMDALAAIFLLAGGIAMAVMLKGISCGDLNDTWNFYLVDGGYKRNGNSYQVGWAFDIDDEDKAPGLLKGRCQRIEADAAFMFLGFIVSIGGLVWMYFATRRSFGRTNKTHVTSV
ncbi:hypothetical protein K431DRAFT_230864 [Polychaeton citri CBS 116435]|uniref:MARVEL domain-containing protein n=1 Tax=Polychaeton citri CBS 116435 TaxID=1314669 RepID=A0A9P4Q0M2_9PEZI|nr:hypothetical protein K431DRAFT_230864 [Polychaeton citri CBS 116435]